MDNTYWLNSNSTVAFLETKKQFFGEYIQRVTYSVPAASVINKVAIEEIPAFIETRRSMYAELQNLYWSPRYCASYAKNENADVAMLKHFGSLKLLHTSLKYRLDATAFNVYSNSESDLKAFNDGVDPIYASGLQSVTSPKDAAAQQLLENGHILGAHKAGVKYKVMFCDGRFDPSAKKQLLAYFDSLGDAVQLSKASRRSLSNGFPYTWGNYMHTNDSSIVTFVSLIVPGFVGKIYELTKI